MAYLRYCDRKVKKKKHFNTVIQLDRRIEKICDSRFVFFKHNELAFQRLGATDFYS